jgi:transposase
MAIIGGFDLHRRQLTYDYLDVVTGQVDRGRVVPADRGHLRSLLARFEGQGEVAFAVEGCTGWRYVVEELERAGIGAHLAEPAETAAKRGRKRRAKTDRSDARHLRELLVKGDLPESWIPPAQVLEARARVRLDKDLEEERTAWLQRVQATLYHQGVPVIVSLTSAAGQARLTAAELSPAGRQAVEVGLRQPGRLSGELDPLRAELARLLPPPAGLPGAADHPLWDRPDHLGGDLGRDGRHPPLLVLRRRRASRRPGQHRLRLRHQASQGPPGPPRAGHAALGAV